MLLAGLSIPGRWPLIIFPLDFSRQQQRNVIVIVTLPELYVESALEIAQQCEGAVGISRSSCDEQG
jgi:hypothetical protein